MFLKQYKENLNKIQSFIGQELDKDGIASCIDKSLYRNKV